MTLVLLEWAILSTVVALFSSLGWMGCESSLKATRLVLHKVIRERDACWARAEGAPRASQPKEGGT